MHKLARLHFHQCGYRDSFKERLTLDFRDPRDGRLHDAVLNLENGGGKTGLLALFFSVFVTDKSRYLRTLIRKHERFQDDFHELPGAIVAEWALPEATTALVRGDPRRLVTAQLVRPIRRAGVPELERHFLIFRAAPAFDFDTFVTSLCGGDSAPLSSDALPAWLHRLRGDVKPLQFYDTTNQEQWRSRLDSEGLDVELLRMQVDFNRDEGGVDRFLDIRDERDFLIKFLGLVLNAEVAESTRSLLASNIAKLGQRQSLKERQAALTELAGVFGAFAAAAAGLDEARQRLRRQQGEALGLRAALDVQRQSADAAFEAGRAVLLAIAERQRAVDEQREQVTADLEALDHDRLHRQQSRAKAALHAGQQTLDAARLDRQLCQAAALRREIVRRVSGKHRLEMQIEAALRDLEQPRRDARKLGAQLHAALASVLAVLDKERRVLDETASALNLRRTAIKAERLQQQARRSTAERAQAQAQAAINQHDRQRAQLQAERIDDQALLHADETADDGQARWNSLARLASDTMTALDAECRDDETAKAAQDELRRQLRDRRAVAEAAQRLDQAALAQAEARRDALAVQPALVAACDTTRIDPASGETTRLVADRLAKLAARLRDAERSIEHAEADATALARAGLSGIDADALRVADALRHAGVADAQPYARWLAELEADPEVLRGHALADPARWTGVYVPTAVQLDAVNRLDRRRLALNRPVQVSVGAVDSAAPVAEVRVLSVLDDSAYSLEAGRDRQRGLAAEIAALHTDQQALSLEQQALLAAQSELQAWLAAWSDGRLVALRERTIEQSRQIASLQVAEDQANAAIVALGAAIRARQQRSTMLRDQAHEARDAAQRIERFARDCVLPLAQQRKQLHDTTQALAEAEQVIATLETEAEALRDAEREQDRHRHALATQQDRLRREQGEIGDRDAGAEASSEALDALRSGYHAQIGHLREAEAGRVDGPRGQLLEIERALEAAHRQFAERHQDLADADVAARAGEPMLEQRAEAAERHCEAQQEALGGFKTELSQAGARLEESRRKLSERASARLPHWAGFEEHALAAQLAELRQAMAALEAEKIALASRHAAQLRDNAAQQERLRAFRGETDALNAILGTAIAAMSAVRLAVELDAVHAQVQTAVTALRETEAAERKALEMARLAHEAVRRQVGAAAFAVLEPAIAAELASNELEAACEEAARLARQLDERLASVQADLDELDADHGRCLDKLVELSKQAEHQLRAAAERGVVPMTVPRFGGQPVLKLRSLWDKVNAGLRRHHLDRYVADLARAQRLPETAAMLAAECIDAVGRAVWADKGLGIEILKTNSEGELRHVPIDRFGSSGGERLTSALLLYLVLARLRADARVSGLSSGGVLVLDNPFGQANKPLFVQMQRALAQAMDVQLIYTTGIQDLNALAEFQLVIRMRRARKRGGRTLVEAVHLIDGEVR